MIIYAPLSLLLWSAVRFGPLGTSASVLLLTVAFHRGNRARLWAVRQRIAGHWI